MSSRRAGLLLWHKLLLLLAVPIVVLALGLSFATWRSVGQASRQIGLDGKEILSRQAETFLTHLVRGQVDTLDLQLVQTQTVVAYGSILLSESPAEGALDSAQLEKLLPALLERANNSTTAYFVNLTGDLWVYPALDPELALPPDFNLIQEPFFPSPSDFQNRPDEVVWSQVHVNPLDVRHGLVVDAIAPIVIDGVSQGYVGVSVSLAQLIAQFNQRQPIRGSYTFLMDKDLQLVAAPPHAWVDLAPPTATVTRAMVDLSDTGNPELNIILQNMSLGQTSLNQVVIREELKYLAYQPLSQIDWSLGLVVPVPLATVASAQLVEVVEAGGQKALVGMLFWAGGLLLVALVVGGVLTQRLTSPIRDMVVVTESIAGGDRDRRVEVTSRDEIGNLASAFNSMTDQLQALITNLEQRVSERTRGLQAAAEVARATTSLLDLDELLHRVVDLARERFGLYYVGLFLLDDAGKFAVLRAGTDEAGQQMLAQGHSLAVGGSSMVGQCVARGEAQIALEVSDEAVRFDNPLLPETRSEMALPLRSRGRIIGAMTVQSVKEAAFDETDIAVMQTLADQTAVAIDNARLFAEARTALQEMETTQRRYLRQVWTEYTRGRAISGYEYFTEHGQTQARIVPLGDDVLPEVQQVITELRPLVGNSDGDAGQSEELSPSVLAVPIVLRGQPIGALGFKETERGRQWNADDIALAEAIAEQLALAADNLRLLDDTQRRAARERLTGQITARMRETLDVDTILRTAVREISQALGMAALDVRLGAEVGLEDSSK